MNDKPLILIVDDEPYNVDYLEQELEDLDYDTISAANGQEALDQVAAHAPDMILLDIMMPILDGFGVLERLKANKQWRDIPVVVISAMSDMDSVARGIEMGAEDYLPKPFDPVLLEARLTAGLEKKRLRDIEVEYLQQVEILTGAATAVQDNRFEEEALQPVAARADALGNLARVFQNMAREVRAREQRLRHRIEQLQLDMAEQEQAAGETADLYIPMDRRHALARGEELPEQTSGAALFADISGFTPLTNRFAGALGRKRGAEEITRLVNQVFKALIGQVHKYGGSVIGFSGDAITCWFDGQATTRAVAAGLAMQAAMKDFSQIQAPIGDTIALDLKVAIAAGPVHRLVAGDTQIQRMEVLAGRTMDALSRAEQGSKPGEVVLSAATVNDQVRVAEWRSEEIAVIAGLEADVEPTPWVDLPALPDDRLRPWLHGPVHRMIREGTQQFMSELRSANALFLQFGGINYDDDPQAGAKLDQFVRWAQGIIDHYGGHLLQVTTGDKGSYLYASFGVLVAHEDDALRTTLAALDLQSAPDMPFITHIQIGLTKGEMCVGSYGSPGRRSYGALGDKTNLAARLMVSAQEGILCDQAIYQAARKQIEFDALPPLHVKGREEAIAVYRPTRVKPGTLHHSLIDQLEPALQMTVKIASISGPSFTQETLLAICPTPVDKKQVAANIEQLLATGLLQEKAGAYAFANSFIQDAAYNRLLFAQRRQLHRALAEWLENAEGERSIEDYERLAFHWRRAEDLGKTMHYLEKAGESARHQGHRERAVAYYNQALQLEAEAAVLGTDYQE